MFTVRSIAQEDLEDAAKILSDWLTDKEVEHYVSNIREIITLKSSTRKFDSQYFVATIDDEIVGMAGFRLPSPRLNSFVTTARPVELCMLYVANQHRGGSGVGTTLLNHIFELVRNLKYQEMIVHSAKRFIDSGWGFYDKKGFQRVGQLDIDEPEKTAQIWRKEITQTLIG